MSTDALVSLAILKVNWDRLGRDYVENFVPFIAEALRHSPDDVVSLPTLQRELRQRFGLDLPLNPLRQVLQRAAKHNFVRRQSGVFYRNPTQLATLNFADVRNAVVSNATLSGLNAESSGPRKKRQQTKAGSQLMSTLLCDIA